MTDAKGSIHVRACLYCHESVARNARFCPHCGARGPRNRVALLVNTRWPLVVAPMLAIGLYVLYRLSG